MQKPGHGQMAFQLIFLKTFLNLFSPLLTSVSEESFATQILPLSMRPTVILLLPKKDKDPLNCGSYRPISSLNTDARLLVKVLAR